MSPRGLFVLVGGLLLAFCPLEDSRAQQQPPTPNAAPADTSGAATSTGAQSGAGASKKAVDFSARDSLVIRTDTSGQDYGTLHTWGLVFTILE